MKIPPPRGPLTDLLAAHLPGPVGSLPGPVVARALAARRPSSDPLADDDLQLALTLCYELHYRGLAGVNERWEWDPSLLALRSRLEDEFVTGLTRVLPALPAADRIESRIRALVDADDGPALAAYLQRRGTAEQFREFVIHRSIYELKEADPHSWAIPRLTPRPKAALLEVQFDEYGAGRVDRMHAVLFAGTMRALGLDDTYGAYLDLVPGSTLATVNLISMFGLHRRWRGALLGHLAVYEMTSSIPNRRYGNALRRLGFARDATEFYDEHVEADAVHEQVALVDLCGSFAADEPDRAGDVLFGAAGCLAVEARFAGQLLEAWSRGASSLLPAGAVQASA